VTLDTPSTLQPYLRVLKGVGDGSFKLGVLPRALSFALLALGLALPLSLPVSTDIVTDIVTDSD
jgi:hypothetical protein